MPAAPLSFPPIIKSVEAIITAGDPPGTQLVIKMVGWYFNTRIEWLVTKDAGPAADWDGTYWETDFPDDWAAALLPYGYLPNV